MHPTRTSELGIGSPSKYADLPVLSLGMSATVALKRARRAIPQQMKAVRAMMSAVLRSPIAKPRNAGATPKEICGKKGSIRFYEDRRGRAYGVCQTVKLLTEHTGLLSPPGYLAIQEVEQHAKERCPKSDPGTLTSSVLATSGIALCLAMEGVRTRAATHQR